MTTFKALYNFSDEVYLSTDPEQYKRLVTGVYFRPGGVVYEVMCGTEASEHYEFELSPKPDMVTKTR